MKITQRILIAMVLLLPWAGAGAQVDNTTSSSLSRALQSQPTPLPIEQAFPYFVSELSPGKYRVSWELAPGHYLYRHAFQFGMQQAAAAETLPVEFVLPQGLRKTDQFFGEIEAYYNQVSVDLSLTTVPGPEAAILIEYQGCADWGFCYPPQRAVFKLLP